MKKTQKIPQKEVDLAIMLKEIDNRTIAVNSLKATLSLSFSVLLFVFKILLFAKFNHGVSTLTK